MCLDDLQLVADDPHFSQNAELSEGSRQRNRHDRIIDFIRGDDIGFRPHIYACNVQINPYPAGRGVSSIAYPRPGKSRGELLSIFRPI